MLPIVLPKSHKCKNYLNERTRSDGLSRDNRTGTEPRRPNCVPAENEFTGIRFTSTDYLKRDEDYARRYEIARRSSAAECQGFGAYLIVKLAQWVPTSLIIGLYNTIKQEGHDQFDRGIATKATQLSFVAVSFAAQ